MERGIAAASLDRGREVTLLDILDAVLDKGVIIAGDLVITVANIDLVSVDLRLLVTSVESMLTKDTPSQTQSPIVQRLAIGEGVTGK